MRTSKKTRTNQEWLADLRSEGAPFDQALTDLTEIILSGLPYALSKWLPADDPRFAPLAEEVVQETILRVLSKLDTFKGLSQFTTWVYTIAVRVALTELRRARWKEVSLEEFLAGRNPGDEPRELAHQDDVDVEKALQKKEALAVLSQVIEETLTEKQRLALVAVALKGVPMSVVAQRMDMTRNALYKLTHDARQKLKSQLEKEGLSTQEMFKVFEQ